jgi:hypothetical protein
VIIIPEKKVVLITPPRTGSTLLKELVPKHYPRAFQPYRHMEADGVPHGYDRWPRIGVFRPPLFRLWSLYNWCKTLPGSNRGTPAWRRKVALSVNRGFEAWLLNNSVVFTDPYDSAGMDFWPEYTVLHAIPENLKSLFHYLRPDLGTEVVTLQGALDLLEISTERVINSAFDEGEALAPPPVSGEVVLHLEMFHGWDLQTERRFSR